MWGTGALSRLPDGGASHQASRDQEHPGEYPHDAGWPGVLAVAEPAPVAEEQERGLDPEPDENASRYDRQHPAAADHDDDACQHGENRHADRFYQVPPCGPGAEFLEEAYRAAVAAEAEGVGGDGERAGADDPERSHDGYDPPGDGRTRSAALWPGNLGVRGRRGSPLLRLTGSPLLGGPGAPLLGLSAAPLLRLVGAADALGRVGRPGRVRGRRRRRRGWRRRWRGESCRGGERRARLAGLHRGTTATAEFGSSREAGIALSALWHWPVLHAIGSGRRISGPALRCFL